MGSKVRDDSLVYRRALCFVIFTCRDASSTGVGGQLRLGDRRNIALVEQPSHEASGMPGGGRTLRRGRAGLEVLPTIGGRPRPEVLATEIASR